MSIFSLFSRPIPKRNCTFCGMEMMTLPSRVGTLWECPRCHSQLNEVGSISDTTGPRDLITQEQADFFRDLGETQIPRFKDEATTRIKEIVEPFESWLASCFTRRKALQPPDKRKLEIALQRAKWAERLPRLGDAFTENQRLEYLRFTKDVLGPELFQKMSPKNINKYADALGVPLRKGKEKEIKFECSGCGQTYAAPEEIAGTSIICQSCNLPLNVPRPAIGYFAAPSESQMDDAFLYGVSVPEGMHRGDLKAELIRAQLDPSRQPRPGAYEQLAQRKFARELKNAEDNIARIEAETTSANLSSQQKKELRVALKKAEEWKEAVIDIEAERKRENEREAKEEAREEVEFRREYYESEFDHDGDWSEFYRKPTRAQFDAIYEWLDHNKPGWREKADVIAAIDLLFPELTK